MVFFFDNFTCLAQNGHFAFFIGSHLEQHRYNAQDADDANQHEHRPVTGLTVSDYILHITHVSPWYS